MKPLTDTEQEVFLNAVRNGDNRSQAAQKIGRTGNQLRRMMNPDAHAYNQELHVAYTEATAQRDEHRTPQTTPEAPTVNGNGLTKAAYLTDQDLDAFLEDISAGVPRDLAARKIGTSLVQINRKANREPELATRYAAALEEGYPHYQDWLRGKVVDLIEQGNYPALRDQILVHLPEADKLRTSKHEISGPGGGAIKMLQAVLPELPPELLDELIHHAKELEARKAAIEPGPQ